MPENRLSIFHIKRDTTVPDGWSALIDSWGTNLDRYEELAGDDFAYWHGEEALTASLVSAAHQAGGIGLAEFETQRIRRLREQSGKGSGDAYLCIGGNWYTIEAKLCWITQDAEMNMEAARTDLRTIRESDRAGAAVAICYCVPEIKESSAGRVIERVGSDFSERFPKSNLLVTYAPKGKRVPEQGGKLYPGLVVLGEFVKWESQPSK